ncbi:MAG: GntR family transcriptional regulator [Bacteroidota bacterium]
MIQLDRDASTPIAEQLAEQLRFHLATGRFRPGERLPSTRAFGQQLGVSFHTIRKAYQQLEAEGLLDARRGSGYTVTQRAPAPAADRMERGAAVVQDAIQKLIGLGLDDGEVEYLFQEQLAFLDDPGVRPKVVFAAAYRELAETCAEQVSAAIQERVEAVRLDALAHHADADLVVTPHASAQAAAQAVPLGETVSVLVHPPPATLARVARLLPTDTLGVVTRHDDAVAPLLAELRSLTAFSGTALALPSDANRERLAGFCEDIDLLLFTPQARRKLRPLLTDTAHAPLRHLVNPASLDGVREAVRR